MKYKQDEKQTKYDYTLWYGNVNHHARFRGPSVQYLIRNRPVATRKECNCVNKKTGQWISNEELCFGSRKAAARYIRKHSKEIIDNYEKKHSGSCPPITHVAAFRHHHHGKTPLLVNIGKMRT